jgi:hypothetical protein
MFCLSLYEVHCFCALLNKAFLLCFLRRLSYTFVTGISEMLGTKQAFSIEDGFQCF